MVVLAALVGASLAAGTLLVIAGAIFIQELKTQFTQSAALANAVMEQVRLKAEAAITLFAEQKRVSEASRLLAERERDALRLEKEQTKAAIEANALPFYVRDNKSDVLLEREMMEQAAMGKGFDAVEGLGR